MTTTTATTLNRQDAKLARRSLGEGGSAKNAKSFVAWRLAIVLCTIHIVGCAGNHDVNSCANKHTSQETVDQLLDVIGSKQAELVPLGGSDTLCVVAAREAGKLDELADDVVYPVLLRHVESRSSHIDIALGLIEIRAYGGIREVQSKGYGCIYGGKPVPGAEIWVAKLPRQNLEDLYLASHHDPAEFMVGVAKGPPQRGSCLIRVVDPNNPRWSRPASREEWQAAWKHLSEWRKAETPNSGGQR